MAITSRMIQGIVAHSSVVLSLHSIHELKIIHLNELIQHDSGLDMATMVINPTLDLWVQVDQWPIRLAHLDDRQQALLVLQQDLQDVLMNDHGQKRPG